MGPIRARIPIVFFFIMATLLLSFGKMSFLFNLIRASFIIDPAQDKKIEILAKSFLGNKRLYPIITRQYPNDDRFLASLTMQMMENGKPVEPRGSFDLMLPAIIEKFPEDIFLDSFNFYRGNSGLKDWENFDLLFFMILRSPKFNNMSKQVLMRSIGDQKISSQTLFRLVQYLSWMKNYSLAEDLLNWGFKQNKFDKESYGFLQRDLLLRKRRKELQTAYDFSADRMTIGNMLRKFSHGDTREVRLVKHLFPDWSVFDRGSPREHWIFSDMSDMEPFSKGSFYGNSDLTSDGGLRVMGFFVKPIKDRAGSRAGFLYKEDIPLNERIYLFCFRYRTFQGEEWPTFWLAYGFNKEWELPPTYLKWRHVNYIFDNRVFKIPSIKPLLRMWGRGSVWFDNVYLFEIDLGQAFNEKDVISIN